MGRTKIHGWVAGSLDEAHELVQELVKRPAPVGEFLTFAGASCYCKAGKLKGRSRWRHALRGWLRLGHAPCVQEYFNMCWLHNRHFQVPLPLVGGVVRRHGLPAYQFLITRQVLGSATLDEALDSEPQPRRRELLRELAQEVGRMHALSFVHHDLFPRNILVAPADWPRRILFLDLWAGGDCLHFRPPAYDLGGFLLESAHLLVAEERREFLEDYRASCQSQGRSAPADLLNRIGQQYGKLHRRLAQQPGRLRGRPLPEDWAVMKRTLRAD
jgi:tRNA A-37 threonylcarbamoyl transferase component Bud32